MVSVEVNFSVDFLYELRYNRIRKNGEMKMTNTNIVLGGIAAVLVIVSTIGYVNNRKEQKLAELESSIACSQARLQLSKAEHNGTTQLKMQKAITKVLNNCK
jgi:ABC-type lipoprotein release transport system permease subunit